MTLPLIYQRASIVRAAIASVVLSIVALASFESLFYNHSSSSSSHPTSSSSFSSSLSSIPTAKTLWGHIGSYVIYVNLGNAILGIVI